MAARTGNRGSLRAGFALVEVILALVLIGLLAAIALPGLVRATGPGTLRAVAMEATALLREDRNEAMNTGRPTAIVVDLGGRRIRSVSSQAAITLPPGAAAGLRSGATSIRFFATGRSSGGDLVLASATARYIVSVSPDTGAILVAAP